MAGRPSPPPASPPDAAAPAADRGGQRRATLGVIAACATILVVLAVLYSLHAARAFLVPVVLALLLAIVLNLPARSLRRLGLPSWLAAMLTVLVFLGTVFAGAWFLSAPAEDWLERGPRLVHDLKAKLLPLTRSLDGAGEMTADIDRMTGGDASETTVRVAEASLLQRTFSQVQSVLAGGAIVVVLLFFLLAGGQRTVAAIAMALPARQRVVYDGIVRQVEVDIALYLQTVTLINIGLGVVTGAALWAAGMPSPALWGALVAVLNFMPYLGAAMSLAVIALVSAVTFSTLSDIVLPPLLFLGLTSLEGHFLTPSIVGKRLTLNPLVVFLSVVAWGSLWGVAGALLAVPIMATVKIVLDNTGRLRWLRAAME
jgi:predicted PurR-regulated permease PerM